MAAVEGTLGEFKVDEVLLNCLESACTTVMRVPSEVMPPLETTAMTPEETACIALLPELRLLLTTAERRELVGSWGAGERVGRGELEASWEGAEDCVGKGGEAEGVGCWVLKGAKDMVGEEVALALSFAPAEEVGRGSREGAAVRVAEGLPEGFPGVSVDAAEVEEVGEDPGVVEGTLRVLCVGVEEGDPPNDTLAALLGVEVGLPVQTAEAPPLLTGVAVGLPDHKAEAVGRGVVVVEGVLVCTLAREASAMAEAVGPGGSLVRPDPVGKGAEAVGSAPVAVPVGDAVREGEWEAGGLGEGVPEAPTLDTVGWAVGVAALDPSERGESVAKKEGAAAPVPAPEPDPMGGVPVGVDWGLVEDTGETLCCMEAGPLWDPHADGVGGGEAVGAWDGPEEEEGEGVEDPLDTMVLEDEGEGEDPGVLVEEREGAATVGVGVPLGESWEAVGDRVPRAAEKEAGGDAVALWVPGVLAEGAALAVGASVPKGALPEGSPEAVGKALA